MHHSAFKLRNYRTHLPGRSNSWPCYRIIYGELGIYLVIRKLAVVLVDWHCCLYFIICPLSALCWSFAKFYGHLSTSWPNRHLRTLSFSSAESAQPAFTPFSSSIDYLYRRICSPQPGTRLGCSAKFLHRNRTLSRGSAEIFSRLNIWIPSHSISYLAAGLVLVIGSIFLYWQRRPKWIPLGCQGGPEEFKYNQPSYLDQPKGE